jgi:hypothetical protein
MERYQGQAAPAAHVQRLLTGLHTAFSVDEPNMEDSRRNIWQYPAAWKNNRPVIHFMAAQDSNPL